jgi:hypothetical protein
MPKSDRARAHVATRRRDRFLHHVAQVAGHRHAALAGHHDAFDGQQLAADFGPGEARDDADLIFGLGLAVAVLRHAEISCRGCRRDRDLLLLVVVDLLHRLAGQLASHLALQRAHAASRV